MILLCLFEDHHCLSYGYQSVSQCLLNRHLLSISLSRLDFLASFLDGSEDGLVWEVFSSFDLGGLLVEGNIEGFNTCKKEGS